MLGKKFVAARDAAPEIVALLINLQAKHPEWTLADYVIATTTVQTMLLAQLPYAKHLEVVERAREILRSEFDKRVR